jgi:hypothetical protein
MDWIPWNNWIARTVVNQSPTGVLKIECALLIEIRGHALVRIVSCGADIVIPRHIQTPDRRCFQHCNFSFSITFAADSELAWIKAFAFERSKIDSIAIPRNVRFIEPCSFRNYGSLALLSFEPGSKLQWNAFEWLPRMRYPGLLPSPFSTDCIPAAPSLGRSLAWFHGPPSTQTSKRRNWR